MVRFLYWVRRAAAVAVLAVPCVIATAPQGPARAQEAGPDTRPSFSQLTLSAVIGQGADVITQGLVWRIFAQDPSSRAMREVARSEDAVPTLDLPRGEYVIHAALGLASATRRITLGAEAGNERLSLPAGGITVRGVLNEQPIDPADLTIAIFIPSEINSEERLVSDQLKAGEILQLPEGRYHIVSTYGASNASVRADIDVRTGKTVDVLMRHRAARITLKLVGKPGGEALTNTEWTVLTPGGDVVREELGAFPSMILAEGVYTVIARHDGQTFVQELKVATGPDRDVEVLATGKAQ